MASFAAYDSIFTSGTETATHLNHADCIHPEKEIRFQSAHHNFSDYEVIKLMHIQVL